MSQETVNRIEPAQQARGEHGMAHDSMSSSIATRFKPSKPEYLVRPTGVKPPPPKK